jgi:uncharacterized cofD-like protein
MEWPETSMVLHGEGVIDAKSFENDPRKAALSLVPNAKANPAALQAIDRADLVVIAPGDLYTSLGPLLVIEGIGEALRETRAKIVYVSNLVTKYGQTEGFTVADHADEIERFGGGKFLDCVLYNQQTPDRELAEKYEAEKAYLVEADVLHLKDKHYKAVGGDFLGTVAKAHANDSLPVTRSLIRHDSARVARAIIELYNSLNVR